MQSTGFRSWLPIVLGRAAGVGVTYAQGKYTNRWSGTNVAAELSRDAELLETRFPESFGVWRMVSEDEADPAQLKAAGAVGHISRRYANDDTGATVGVFIVCATPHDASGHTPDRCYPSAGFEIGEQEHREVIPLPNGTKAEAFSGTFKKPGAALRIFWTYAAGGRWIAPQIARIELANNPSVFKIYAIVDETLLSKGEGSRIGAEFLSELIPEFDRLITTQSSTPDADVPARVSVVPGPTAS